ncbi:MAG TPA: hypothetical protein VFP36_02965 [Usitatibacter sp.]|nr:hypothetical protein [Usitatibacter sp.]
MSSSRTLTSVLAFSVAAFVAPGLIHAKPAPGAPLSAAVCKAINGEWTSPYTCTIPEGTSAVASSPFKIGAGVTLDIRGSLTIDRGVTVANMGAITIANSGSVAPGDWEAGVRVFGTLDNSGTITIQNVYYGTDTSGTEGTEGIFVSLTIDPADSDRVPFVVVPGTLTNSGVITIQNSGNQTRGIKNDGAMVNSASGVITVGNSLSGSRGIYNRRGSQGSTFYINGTVTNAGSMTISNSGDSDSRGLYNQGVFTISANGILTIEPSSDAAMGVVNGGSITSFGTYTNNRGALDNPEASLGTYNFGTMVNYGSIFASGIFYNESIMVNIGTITSHGGMADVSYGQTMLNYGTIYNYGGIGGGVNKGFCIDEPGDLPGFGC